MPAKVSSKPPERLIVYVDGFNLYHGLKERSGRRLLWLDLVKLSRLLRPRSSLIATALVADAASGVADSALIVSADSDLSPAVRTARLLNSTLFMAAAFPPKRYSAELRNLMPASFAIGLSKLTGAQLPRTVVDQVSDRSFSRPSKWT